jgi:glutathione S-transferase
LFTRWYDPPHRAKWTTNFGIVPKLPQINAYIERVGAHPDVIRAGELDAALMAQREAEAAGVG